MRCRHLFINSCDIKVSLLLKPLFLHQAVNSTDRTGIYSLSWKHKGQEIRQMAAQSSLFEALIRVILWKLLTEASLYLFYRTAL